MLLPMLESRGIRNAKLLDEQLLKATLVVKAKREGA